jgi:hypothetical protein
MGKAIHSPALDEVEIALAPAVPKPGPFSLGEYDVGSAGNPDQGEVAVFGTGLSSVVRFTAVIVIILSFSEI